MRYRHLLFCCLGLLSISEFSLGAMAIAGQIQYCYPIQKTRTLQDPGSHPQAYDNGYREGAATARAKKPYEPRSAGGEFARGFEDGYYGRPYAGQQNTVPDRTDTYSTKQCRTYYYNDTDPASQSIKRVLDNFQDDFRRDWNLR